MIGLGSYSFFWQHSDANPNKLSLAQEFEATKELGCDVFQIIDYAPLEKFTEYELAVLASKARELDLAIELGTRGVEIHHLKKYLDLAQVFGANLVRSMIFSATSRPSLSQAAELLKEVMPLFESRQVHLALETYEQVATADLVALIEKVSSPNLGICLDPANVVARLEMPADCIDLAAPFVKNVHVKDFAFSREDGWVGFKYSGVPMGEGLLDYQHLLASVKPRFRGINEIVEHWLPFNGSISETVVLEKYWTKQTINYLRSINE